MRDQLRLTPSRNPDGSLHLVGGLIQFRLGVWVKGEEVDNFTVLSGAPGLQNLKRFSDSSSLPGSLEPIPEGLYAVGPVEWAFKNDLKSSWGAGLGPVWSDLSPISRGGRRSAFGIHLDSNNSYAPGSAGCVVFETLSELQRYLEMRKRYPQIDLLVVDYNLGDPEVAAQRPSINKPSLAKKESKFKLFVNENGATLVVAQDLKAGSYTLVSDGAWVGKFIGQ